MKNIPNIPATDSAWTTLAPDDVARAEDAQRHQRVRRPRLADDEAGRAAPSETAPSTSVWPAPQPYSAAGLTIV